MNPFIIAIDRFVPRDDGREESAPNPVGHCERSAAECGNLLPISFTIALDRFVPRDDSREESVPNPVCHCERSVAECGNLTDESFYYCNRSLRSSR